MAMSNFWSRFFGRAEETTSKSVAKERLRLVLVHDRLDVSEQTMNDLREELIAVIGRYMVIDEPSLEVSLTREDDGVALIANIPILNVRRPTSGDGGTPAKPAQPEAKSAPAEPEQSGAAQATPEEPAKKKKAPKADGVEAYIEA